MIFRLGRLIRKLEKQVGVLGSDLGGVRRDLTRTRDHLQKLDRRVQEMADEQASLDQQQTEQINGLQLAKRLQKERRRRGRLEKLLVVIAFVLAAWGTARLVSEGSEPIPPRYVGLISLLTMGSVILVLTDNDHIIPDLAQAAVRKLSPGKPSNE
jgi:hypothetical protein